MSNFDDFIETVLKGAKDLAKQIFKGFEEQARKDTKEFLEKMKDDLQRWVGLLTEEKLTKDDFKDLIKAKKALVKMHALTQMGIILTKLERFRMGLINLIIDAAFKTLL